MQKGRLRSCRNGGMLSSARDFLSSVKFLGFVELN